MKIAVLGDNLEAEIALNFLLKNGIPISAILTAQSTHKSDYSDLGTKFSSIAETTVVNIDDINSSQTHNQLNSLELDYLFVLGWSNLLKAETIKCFKKGVFGSHPSKLPYGRGRAPLVWTMLEGASENAISVFSMTPRADDGDLMVQIEYQILPEMNIRDLYLLNAKKLGEAYFELYNQLISNTTFPIAQDHSKATYRSARIPADGIIRFSDSVETIDRLVRALGWPYPGAYAYMDYQRIVFGASDILRGYNRIGLPGQVLERTSSGVVVQCGNGSILFSDLKTPLSENAWRFEEYQQVSPSTIKAGSRFGFAVEDAIAQIMRDLPKLKMNRS